jgi:hypothetical protein
MNMETPWGEAQTVRDIGDGILQVTTACHGGYFVPQELLYRIPESQRDYAAAWSGSGNWFEEDDAARFVEIAFPEHFAAQRVDWAAKYVARELSDITKAE